MKARTIEAVVTNEEHVRLAIYDGRITVDEAGAELLRIEKAQHVAALARHLVTLSRCSVLLTALVRIEHCAASAISGDPLLEKIRGLAAAAIAKATREPQS